jgi:hypothetical protein
VGRRRTRVQPTRQASARHSAGKVQAGRWAGGMHSAGKARAIRRAARVT